MISLDAIGLKYKTDKSSMTHCYLDNYEKYFASWRDKEFTLLEIGVAGGASIRTWREYFTKAKIFGIDNNPDCAGEGIYIGDQKDVMFIPRVLEDISIHEKPSIVIDDGSHVGDDMVSTFRLIFPYMKSGGYYVLEDTHCLYSNHYSGEFENNGRTRGYNYFTDLAYHVDVAGRGMCGEPNFCINHPTTDPPVPEYSRILDSIHIHTSLWLFKRR